MKSIRVLVTDKRILVREALERLLSSDPSIKVVGSLTNCVDIPQFVSKNQVDVVLLDVNESCTNATETCQYILQENKTIKVICLSETSEFLLDLLQVGVSGYLLFKDVSATQLIQAVVGVAAGECHISNSLVPKVIKQMTRPRVEGKKLTSRDMDILKLLAEGNGNRTIAQNLYISEKTVKNHLSNLYKKIGVTNRTQAAAYAIKALNV